MSILCVCVTTKHFLIVDPKDAITFLEKTKEKVGQCTVKLLFLYILKHDLQAQIKGGPNPNLVVCVSEY